MLKRVSHPGRFRYDEMLRSGFDDWALGKCQYDDHVRGIKKMGVPLGGIGYYIRGANIPPAIIDFVEEKVRETYPVLEITLIVWLTVFTIPTLFVLCFVIAVIMALAISLGKAWNKVKGGWERRFRHRNSIGPPKNVQPTRDEESQAYELPDWQSERPPSYRTDDSSWETDHSM
jgi:hypothetical protein